METRPPMAKVRHAQDLLDFLELQQPGIRQTLIDASPASVAESLRTASRAAWIPLSEDAKFVDTFVGHYGERAAVEIWTAYTARLVKSPLQRAMFEGAQRLFGLNAQGLARMLPRAWTTAYRNVGSVRAVRDAAGSVRVILSSLPPEMTERRGYFLLLEGLGRGFMRLFGEDESRLGLHIDAEQRTAILEFPAAAVHEDFPAGHPG